MGQTAEMLLAIMADRARNEAADLKESEAQLQSQVRALQRALDASNAANATLTRRLAASDARNATLEKQLARIRQVVLDDESGGSNSGHKRQRRQADEAPIASGSKRTNTRRAGV